MVRILVALLVASPLAAAAQDAATAAGGGPGAPAAYDDARLPAPSGAYVGVGLGPAGLGSGAGTALRVRVGASRSARASFGFEGGLVRNSDEHLASYDVGVTFFPWERFFFVRSGAGLTTRDLHDDPPEHGANVLLGLGVALGSARGLNVTVNVEGQSHWTSRVGGSLHPPPQAGIALRAGKRSPLTTSVRP